MTNKFLEKLTNRMKELGEVKTMSDWVCQNTTIKGKPFSVDGSHLFQKAILDDMHPNLCVKKVAQVGLSEVSIRKAIAFIVRNPGTSVIYSYPDINMKKDNSQTRFKPITDTDFPTPRGMNEVRNTDLYQIGQSFLHLAANVESDATSTPADMIINDEYDLSNQEILALFNSRLQHSSFKIKQGFSTPTFTNFGISLEYESSDQREFMCKCPHCGHWQIPKYDLKNVYISNLPKEVEDLKRGINLQLASTLDLDNAFVCCEKCRKRLDLTNPEYREWVARFPERIHSRGYWVRPFSSDLLSVKYIVMTMADYIKKDKIRRGVNTLLGEEYFDRNSRLEIGDIKQCLVCQDKPEVGKEFPCYLGCDFGETCHMVISDGIDTVFEFRAFNNKDVDKVFEEVFSKYKIVCGALDRHPFIPTVNALRDKYSGIIYPVVYGSKKEVEPRREADQTISFYNINRTSALDYIQTKVNSHSLKIHGYGTYESVVCEHLRDMWREDFPDKEPVWNKMNGNDHFFHAMAYSFVARKIKYVEGLSDNNERHDCMTLIGPNTEDSKKTLYTEHLFGYNDNNMNNITRRRW